MAIDAPFQGSEGHSWCQRIEKDSFIVVSISVAASRVVLTENDTAKRGRQTQL